MRIVISCVCEGNGWQFGNSRSALILHYLMLSKTISLDSMCELLASNMKLIVLVVKCMIGVKLIHLEHAFS